MIDKARITAALGDSCHVSHGEPISTLALTLYTSHPTFLPYFPPGESVPNRRVRDAGPNFLGYLEVRALTPCVIEQVFVEFAA